MKICKKCGLEKEYSCFTFNRRLKDGHGSWCKDCCNLHSRKWYSENQEYNANRKYLYKYGITLDDYKEMYESQGGNCAICGRHKDILDVDHNHSTGEIRKLLCHQCNIGIGAFYDNLELLRLAIEYLGPE